MEELVYFVSEEDSNKRIDVYLTKNMNFSRNYISRLIDEKLIYKNEILIIKPSIKVLKDDKIKIIKKKNEIKKENILSEKIKIIYDHPDFLAINKPAFISVHKANLGDNSYTLVDWINENKIFKDDFIEDNKIEKSGIIHRLDKETSGALLIAKNRNAQNILSGLFEKRLMKKTYLALTVGDIFEKGEITLNILRNPLNPTRMRSSLNQGREAFTEYKLIKKYDNFSQILCFPKTGRTHQIRVHLSSIGFPILGDKVYGKKSDLINRQALHAISLEFFYNNENIKIEAELFDDIKNLINN